MERKTAMIVVGTIIAVIVISIGAYFIVKPSRMNTINIGYQPSTHQIAAMLASEKG